MSKIRDLLCSLFFLMKTLQYIIHVLFFKRILLYLYCTVCPEILETTRHVVRFPRVFFGHTVYKSGL